MTSVLCVGGCVIDILLITEKIPLIDSEFRKFLGIEYGSKTYANDFIINEGGSANNTALNLKSLGVNSAILAVIGDDFLGNYIFEKIKSAGVNTEGLIKTKKGKTGISFIIKSPDFEDRGMITYKGANDLLSEDYIDKKFVEKFKYLVWCSLTSKNALKTLEKLIAIFKERKNPGIVIAAPSSSVTKKFPQLTLNLVKKSDIYSANLEESRDILENQNLSWIECVQKFFDYGLGFVSITNSKEGAIVGRKDDLIKLIPPSIELKETSGVGDAFLAGLIYGIINNKNSVESGKIGTLMAYSVLQGFGTRAGVPNLEQLNKLIKNLSSRIEIIKINGK
ncbi:MAG: carbohydrate kinase family protein [Promethearchaeota archaeon]